MAHADSPDDADEQHRLTGIGGWLILPIIGLVLTIILTVINLLAAMTPESIQGYKAFFDGSLPAAGHPYIYVGLGSGLLGVALLGFAAACLIRMFQQKRDLPRLMVFYYAFLLVVGGYELAAVLALPELRQSNEELSAAIKGFAQPVIAAAIWIPYFRVSKRVKYTFVR
jgi:hypothetical protein